ncbi:MAG: aryl-sulfate sulfotransferase [Myxococcota bacterium]
MSTRSFLALMLPVIVACGGPDDPPPPDNSPVSDLSWELSDVFLGPVTVQWTQREAFDVVVEYQVDDDWRQTPTIEGVEGDNEATVVGIPLGDSAEWRITLTDGTSIDSNDPIEQRPINDGMPLPTITESQPDLWEPTANYLLVSINENACTWCPGVYWLMIIDREGRPVWATRTSPGHWILYAQVSITSNTLLWDDIGQSYDDSVALRAYLDEPVEEIAIPGHHHAMVELPDGTLAWGAGSYTDYTESIMERAPGAVAPTEIWSCENWPALDGEDTSTETTPYSGYYSDGCFGSNALWYDPASDTYTYSWYSVESVVEVDRSTGEATWWSQSGGLPLEGLDNEYSFDPPSSQFIWQHGVEILDNGHLLISSDDADSTLVREYEIDREAKVLREVWSYDPGVYAQFNGDTRRLPGGNTLHGVGAASVLYEVTPDNTVAWRAFFSADKMLGRADVIEDLYDYIAPRE